MDFKGVVLETESAIARIMLQMHPARLPLLV